MIRDDNTDELCASVNTVHAIVDEIKNTLIDGDARLEMEYTFYSLEEALHAQEGYITSL
jgi:hypothetical protein